MKVPCKNAFATCFFCILYININYLFAVRFKLAASEFLLYSGRDYVGKSSVYKYVHGVR